MTETLTAQSLDVGYDPQQPPILRDIGIALSPGSFVGVVGPNGSGKSTLVRALSRVLRPRQGHVRLDRRDLYAQVTARQSAQAIGVVPQSASASLEFTVREIVEMGCAPRLSSGPFVSLSAEDRCVVEEALHLADIEAMADRLAPTLSGGEWQRVLLARTLAQQTPIVLLDEPTAHLDIHHQMQVLRRAQRLAHVQGKAVLAILHDLNLAAQFCDTLALVNRGRIIAQGPPAEVLTEAHIAEVYGARVRVGPHPITGQPLVLALPEPPEESKTARLPVHVICGGGTGTALMAFMQGHGGQVTCGGLNADDADAKSAEWLGVPCACEAPFSPLSDAVLAQAEQMARTAAALILAEVPFGPANLGNLELAWKVQQGGTPVFLLQSPGNLFASRDFTQGTASRLWNQLQEAGGVVVTDLDTVLSQWEGMRGSRR